jgi:hypothetical protein
MTTRHLTPVRHALDNLTTAAARLPATLRNLDACAPGFPATTPGNGSPGGSVGSNGSRTETLAIRQIGTDTSLADRAALDKLVKRIAADTAVLSAITDRWGWAQAGEYAPDAAPRYAGTQGITDVSDRYCVCCARHPDWQTIPTYRGDLCSWCYKFTRVENRQPTLELIDRHNRGGRITPAMVREAYRPSPRKGRR